MSICHTHSVGSLYERYEVSSHYAQTIILAFASKLKKKRDSLGIDPSSTPVNSDLTKIEDLKPWKLK